jgi:hypothetical protein
MMVIYCILITYVLHNDNTYKECEYVHLIIECLILAEKISELHSATAVSHTSFIFYHSGKLFSLNNITAFSFNNAHTKITLKFLYRVFSKLVHGGVT